MFHLQKIKASRYLLKALLLLVGVAGFEPATPCSQSRCASRAALYPEVGVSVSVGVLRSVCVAILSNCGCKYSILLLTPIHP